MDTSRNYAMELVVMLPAATGDKPGFHTLDAVGEAFYVLEGPEVQVKTDLHSWKTYRAGTGERFPKGQTFSRLELRNYGAAAKLKIWVGFGEYIDRRFSLMETQTKCIGQSASELAANQTLALDGVPPVDAWHRKAIVITNYDPTTPIRLLDADDNEICGVFPNTSIMLPITGVVKVHNTTAAVVPCSISEIWYVRG
ncbi:MAG: hypothetical protein ACOC4K_00800 [Verrucomicrobiota bacterium]